MRQLALKAFIALAAIAATPAGASTVVTGQWYTFGYGAAGTALVGGDSYVLGTDPTSIAAPDPSWDFTLATGGTLTVVDGFMSGDRFAIDDNGSLLGDTSINVGVGSCKSDIICALDNPKFSQATFSLGAGSHSITGSVLESPFNTGSGFFYISTVAALPEPSTWAMMLLGFGAAGIALRRGRKTALISA